jgi:tripartite-type tricarboxylate transporter receptor subunit TctC
MKIVWPRRYWLAVLALHAAVAIGPAWAQGSFPAQGVRIVNAFPPGGPSDILSRALAEKMSAALKQTVWADNKAGAGGGIAAAEVARSAPDGYTILSGIDTTFTVNPHVYDKLPFALKDLKPLMILASSGLLVGTHPSLGVKSLAELVAKAQAEPLLFSSGSNGSPGHLAAAILTDATGAKVTHVPYKGNSPAVMALLSGEVQAGVLATPGMLPHVQAGKITALAVTGRQRSPMAPELPTVAEAGLKALELEVLYLTMMPAATPEPVMVVLRRALADALAQPDIRAQLARLDMVPEGLVGDDAARRIAAQGERFARIIRATGMKIE